MDTYKGQRRGTSEVYSQSQRLLLYREVFHFIPERILIIEAYGIA
jgi:hypothetical protein